MPFVRIDTMRADSDRLDGLGRAVHEAMVDTIGIPPDDKFQVLTSHDGIRYDANFLGIQRDDDVVFVSITFRSGRTTEQKVALYKRIAELVEKYTSVEPRNVFVHLVENQPTDWSFGNGIAQYIA
ncbi:tautomerase family protein [Kibdelosporangium philippinense]|uniref:Tautomerase family protein n=2 Tax=Kibdelosporangium philippinense TaxID=211113 RepID=A0ABS8Z992_9PSEU|nr:tautomerase family protein [Kibdelosporangium philippinense]MCE7004441.1 tautomerase family protein [Kibdelosporangium philippinense]